MNQDSKLQGKQVAIWLPGDILPRVDALAHTLRLSRSRLCTNLITVGVEELESMDTVGLVAMAGAIQKLADQIRGMARARAVNA